MKIIEALDYGQSLLEDGSVLKADGTIITQEEYARAKANQDRNKLDWQDVDVNDFISILNSASYATQTYKVEDEVSGMTQSKLGFAIITEDGEPYYLRSSEFSGAEQYQMAEATFSKLLYNVNKNSSEQAFNILVETLEEMFDIKDQVGSMFSPDSETTYLIKKFVKDQHVWSAVYRDGTLSNIKKGERIHQQQEAKPKASKLADMVNNNMFANLH